jgi:predicted MarR family transcription regulator
MKFSLPLPGGGTGMTLFSKLIRTKDLRKLQGDDPKSTKPKLTVISHLILILQHTIHLAFTYSTFVHKKNYLIHSCFHVFHIFIFYCLSTRKENSYMTVKNIINHLKSSPDNHNTYHNSSLPILNEYFIIF